MKSSTYYYTSSHTIYTNILLVIFILLLNFISSVALFDQSFLKFLVPWSLSKSTSRVLHVHSFGAVGDGLHDDTESFRNAWKVACSVAIRSKIVIPEGYTYLVNPIQFGGCKSQVTLRVSGAIIAPKDPENWRGLNPRKWLYFHDVDHLIVEGKGIINGMGEMWWAASCKVNSSNCCHHAPTAVTFHRCNDLTVRDINIVDSQQAHMSITNSNRILVSNITITAPPESPNTDGIHISSSTQVQVRESVIKTGDDCVSIVSNSSQVQITSLTCSSGHGISIGSLGKRKEWSEVYNVTVDRAYLSGTRNGVRIKTWQGGGGFASGILFQNIWMENVTNPIIIDQYYCDSAKPCQNQTSAVSVDGVSYISIKGTSASEEAIRFVCSDSIPCAGIYMEDVQLISYSGVTTSFCRNALVTSSGLVFPPPCYAILEQKTWHHSLYPS